MQFVINTLREQQEQPRAVSVLAHMEDVWLKLSKTGNKTDFHVIASYPGLLVQMLQEAQMLHISSYPHL